MDLKITGKWFFVGGAGSGFGKAVAIQLAREGARILAVSRTEQKLQLLQSSFPEQIEILCGNLFDINLHPEIIKRLKNFELSGAFINAGGPPAGGFYEINQSQWEEAWKTVVSWKIALTKSLVPLMRRHNYGRLLFLESVSVKQAVPNLILSNALRPAVVGFAKTIANEVAADGITVNVLAPGYHTTTAMERLFAKKACRENISNEEAKQSFENEIPVGKIGKPEELASLAMWLLSPLSRYVTGQVIGHDGGMVKGFFG